MGIELVCDESHDRIHKSAFVSSVGSAPEEWGSVTVRFDGGAVGRSVELSRSVCGPPDIYIGIATTTTSVPRGKPRGTQDDHQFFLEVG